jgi:hypothetical protein
VPTDRDRNEVAVTVICDATLTESVIRSTETTEIASETETVISSETETETDVNGVCRSCATMMKCGDAHPVKQSETSTDADRCDVDLLRARQLPALPAPSTLLVPSVRRKHCWMLMTLQLMMILSMIHLMARMMQTMMMTLMTTMLTTTMTMIIDHRRVLDL